MSVELSYPFTMRFQGHLLGLFSSTLRLYLIILALGCCPPVHKFCFLLKGFPFQPVKVILQVQDNLSVSSTALNNVSNSMARCDLMKIHSSSSPAAQLVLPLYPLQQV